MNYNKNEDLVSILIDKIYEEITQNNKSYTIDKIFKSFNDITPHLVKLFLEKLDEFIFENHLRKKRYESKGFYNRTIITQYGEVSFKRRYYIAKDKTGKDGFLLDRYLNLVPYSKLTRDAKEQVIKSIADNHSYRVAGINAINGVVLTKQSVYNCLKSVTIETKTKKNKIQAPVIHISVDGYYVSQKGNNNKVEKKFANIFTGIENIGKKRNKLINSIIVVQNSHNSFVNAIREALQNNFDLSINPKIILGGDGATWIKTLATELNATFSIDKFHFYKVLKKHIPDDEFFEAMISINKGEYTFYENYKQYFEIIDPITGIVSYDDDYNFIKKNAKYTLTWLDNDYIGTFAEQTVSHVFNLRTRAIPRLWGSNINKVLFLLANSKSDDLIISFDEDPTYFIKGIDELFVPTIDLSSFDPYKKSCFALVNYNASHSKLGPILSLL